MADVKPRDHVLMSLLPRIGMAKAIHMHLCSAALAACAQRPVPVASNDQLFSDPEFSPPTQPVDPRNIFNISPEMRAFLSTKVADEVEKDGAADGLLQALLTDRRMQLAYDSEFTRNAAEAFHARAGNCLSLTIMTGAMARELGLSVRYRSVQVAEHWQRDGDLLERVDHVNVSVGYPMSKFRTARFDPEWWTVDFGPQVETKDQITQPVSESRVAAMFMNNKATEALATNRTDDAYWWIRGAIGLDPSLVRLYNTLGVTYLRRGLLARAETALRFALSIDPESSEAWNNLAVVLRRNGKIEEADSIAAAHVRAKAAAMAIAIEGGIKANSEGDYVRARDLLESALRKSIDNHEIHYWLAVAYLNLGDRGRAMEHFLRAEADSTTLEQRALYRAEIERLESNTRGSTATPDLRPMN